MAKKKRIDRNGYVAVHVGEDLTTADVSQYQYEHILVAEEMLDRPLKSGEVVHHLDSNRSNNSPDNLLVLSGPMHAKLHTWMDKNIIIPKPDYQERIDRGCVRCQICDKPIDSNMKFCSPEHASQARTSEIKPDKETLEALVQNTPMTKIGSEYGVSDNAVRKWCKSYGIELGDRRGHWQKQKYLQDVDVYELDATDDSIIMKI